MIIILSPDDSSIAMQGSREKRTMHGSPYKPSSFSMGSPSLGRCWSLGIQLSYVQLLQYSLCMPLKISFSLSSASCTHELIKEMGFRSVCFHTKFRSVCFHTKPFYREYWCQKWWLGKPCPFWRHSKSKKKLQHSLWTSNLGGSQVDGAWGWVVGNTVGAAFDIQVFAICPYACKLCF